MHDLQCQSPPVPGTEVPGVCDDTAILLKSGRKALCQLARDPFRAAGCPPPGSIVAHPAACLSASLATDGLAQRLALLDRPLVQHDPQAGCLRQRHHALLRPQDRAVEELLVLLEPD